MKKSKKEYQANINRVWELINSRSQGSISLEEYEDIARKHTIAANEHDEVEFVDGCWESTYSDFPWQLNYCLICPYYRKNKLSLILFEYRDAPNPDYVQFDILFWEAERFSNNWTILSETNHEDSYGISYRVYDEEDCLKGIISKIYHGDRSDPERMKAITETLGNGVLIRYADYFDITRVYKD